MKTRLSSWQSIVIGSLTLILASSPGFTQTASTPRPTPAIPAQITLAEARVIIDGAIAYASEANLRASVVILDEATNVVSSARMDGVGVSNIHFAEGKAFASAVLRQTTQALGDLAKTRPDRYSGIIVKSRPSVTPFSRPRMTPLTEPRPAARGPT
jgi:uncharacterized protein GlcG (DUF336 family)